MAWVSSSVTVFFNLALPFPDSFDEMGFSYSVNVGWPDGFEVEWGGSPN